MNRHVAAVNTACRLIVVPVLCSLLLLLDVGSGAAQTPERLGTHGDWIAYTFKENGNKVCYIYSQPSKEEGNYARRGEPHAMVTRRQGSKTIEEVSVTSGYPYKPGSAVKILIDGKKSYEFGLTHQEHAWADDEAEDSAVVKAMVRGLKMSVRGTSQKETYSIDSYSLRGFTKAHGAITKACP